LLLRVWDVEGVARSLRAWRIGSTEDPSPKRLPPAGFRASALVLANQEACRLLRGDGGPTRIVVVEGEPDFLVWATRFEGPVFGVLSGSWSPAIAKRIPYGSEVVVRTHCDVAGEKYAREIIESLRGHASVWRRQVVSKESNA
jgi:hypothetical protein